MAIKRWIPVVNGHGISLKACDGCGKLQRNDPAAVCWINVV
jgi:hypothetical protein